MPASKLENMLGLCTRAGKCVFGESICTEKIRGKKARLVFLDARAGANTAKRIKDACAFHDTRLITFDSEQSDLAAACGKKAVVIAVTDVGFAETLAKLAEEKPQQ